MAQLAPRLNDAPTAGKTMQPIHEPPRQETGTSYIEVSEEREQGEEKGGNTESPSIGKLPAETMTMLPKTYAIAAGLKITASQQTMSGLIGALTGQTFTLSVMLTRHIG